MTTYVFTNRTTGETVVRSERRKPGKDFRLSKIIPDTKPVELPPGCGACGADLELEPHAADCPVELAANPPAQSQSPGLVAGDAGTGERPPPPPPPAQAADGAPPAAPSKSPRKSTAKGSKA